MTVTPRRIDEAHANADTDSSFMAFHHTLGKKNNQAAPGNHNHDERYEPIGGGGNGGTVQEPFGFLRLGMKTGGMLIPGGTWTDIGNMELLIDTDPGDSMSVSFTASQTLITLNKDGIYTFDLIMPDVVTPSSSGVRFGRWIRVSDNKVFGEGVGTASGSVGPRTSAHMTKSCAAGEQWKPQYFQNSGGDQTLSATSLNFLQGIMLTYFGNGAAKGDVGPQGPQGIQGPVGPQGPPGASSSQLPYDWLTNTSASDPGHGKVKVNNATPSSATQCYVSIYDNTEKVNRAITVAEVNHVFWIYIAGQVNHWIKYKITSAPVITANEWATIGVSMVELGSSGFSPVNNQDVDLAAPVQTGTQTYEQNFASPATTWNIAHNFNSKFVNVTAFDPSGVREFDPDIEILDVNNARITWYYPTAGIARVTG